MKRTQRKKKKPRYITKQKCDCNRIWNKNGNGNTQIKWNILLMSIEKKKSKFWISNSKKGVLKHPIEAPNIMLKYLVEGL